METIKVNMTPCEDIKTIHASQNDNEAREWEFELHNNGELIDTSEVSEQMFFKAYKGGTEQILPENGSVPTTAPFLGDIKYPQGILSDQEFLYRESPTEEDGNAKITSIKGNTLVWNQLASIRDRSFTDRGITITTANGKISYSGTTTAGSSPYIDITNSFIDLSKIIAGHKYLISVHDSADGSGSNRRIYIVINNPYTEIPSLSQTASRTIIFTPNATPTYALLRISIGREEGVNLNGNASVVIVDLTQMGLDITDPSDFTSLFSLPYYAYNQGSLLSFNGNGIKTVGKNLLKLVDKSGTYNGITYSCEDNVITLKGTAEGASLVDFSIDGGFLRLYPRFQYTKGLNPTGTYSGVQTSLRGQNADFVTVGFWTNNANPLTMSNLNADAYYFRVQINSGVSVDCTLSAQLEIGNVATDFEPYTSSTLSLPISTYFPTGMKSINPNKYSTVKIIDELTPLKAITRIGSITIDGNTPMNPNGTTSEISAFIMPINGKANGRYNIMSDLFEVADGTLYSMLGRDANNNVQFALPPSVPQTAADGKAWFAQHPTTLYFELATPTETSFTTASLVTENAEIPLSNNDDTLIGKCTEQLSENPGFFDAKIKLSDSDGECYSNKLQLHVERSPQ